MDHDDFVTGRNQSTLVALLFAAERSPATLQRVHAAAISRLGGRAQSDPGGETQRHPESSSSSLQPVQKEHSHEDLRHSPGRWPVARCRRRVCCPGQRPGRSSRARNGQQHTTGCPSRRQEASRQEAPPKRSEAGRCCAGHNWCRQSLSAAGRTGQYPGASLQRKGPVNDGAFSCAGLAGALRRRVVLRIKHVGGVS